ncbi:HAMP domain-containing sensor histidine kinase [Brevibacillus laterosporus]|uniref:sensor histidine kinase n=1 Tax=Brevibacillus laterosporus TaxID=1465 RepID=UPI00215D1132|nr:HAMP domain-containing sensor histidine kinase [Brevibacillus laterosporus]MCR8994382.1 HAMP domain-containing histidine kinase [Brevibacillus laterosporus]
MRWNPFKLIPYTFYACYKLAKKMIAQGKSSLRIQLIAAFGLCVLAGFFVANVLNPYMRTQQAYIDYTQGMENIDNHARNLISTLRTENENKQLNPSYQFDLQEIIDDRSDSGKYRILLADEQGKVLYKSKQTSEATIDIHSVIQNAMDVRIYRQDYQNEAKEFVSFYPVDVGEKKLYLIVRGMPEPSIVYRTGYSQLPGLIGFGVFIFSFYYLTKRKMYQIQSISQGIQEMALGNLDIRVPVNSNDELGQLAQNINVMAMQLHHTREEERKAERTKHELITNVSHDLRTPLTSIMGYLRLIQDRRYHSEGQLEEYAGIAVNKSEQLKRLIEDLFDYTKLSTNGVGMQMQRVDILEMLEQLMEELVPQAEEEGLSFRKNYAVDHLFVHVDADKIVRVFDNLLINAIKYSDKPGEILINAEQRGSSIRISIGNKSPKLTPQELERLFERFYKVDESRSMVKEGSGLGLAIAKSIVELHCGKIWAESHDNMILFYVELPQ